jgi:hypothetical protein
MGKTFPSFETGRRLRQYRPRPALARQRLRRSPGTVKKPRNSKKPRNWTATSPVRPPAGGGKHAHRLVETDWPGNNHSKLTLPTWRRPFKELKAAPKKLKAEQLPEPLERSWGAAPSGHCRSGNNNRQGTTASLGTPFQEGQGDAASGASWKAQVPEPSYASGQGTAASLGTPFQGDQEPRPRNAPDPSNLNPSADSEARVGRRWGGAAGARHCAGRLAGESAAGLQERRLPWA